MIQIGSSEAPAGATHWGPGNRDFNEAWYRVDGHAIYSLMPISRQDYGWLDSVRPLDQLIPLPLQGQEWSGVGLPPTGAVCELRCRTGGWGKAEIKYISQDVCVWLWIRDGAEVRQIEHGGDTRNIEFRPICTPEQIAAQEREKAIREMTDIGIHATTRWAEAIYDAGYRKLEGGAR